MSVLHVLFLLQTHNSEILSFNVKLHVFFFSFRKLISSRLFPFRVLIILQYSICGILIIVPSIFVGATLVVSGDGRYYSKEAIQVL